MQDSDKNSNIHDDRKYLLRDIYTGLVNTKDFMLKQIKTFVLILIKKRKAKRLRDALG